MAVSINPAVFIVGPGPTLVLKGRRGQANLPSFHRLLHFSIKMQDTKTLSFQSHGPPSVQFYVLAFSPTSSNNTSAQLWVAHALGCVLLWSSKHLCIFRVQRTNRFQVVFSRFIQGLLPASWSYCTGCVTNRKLHFVAVAYKKTVSFKTIKLFNCSD